MNTKVSSLLYTGCPNKHENSATILISSLKMIFHLLPNRKAKNRLKLIICLFMFLLHIVLHLIILEIRYTYKHNSNIVRTYIHNSNTVRTVVSLYCLSCIIVKEHRTMFCRITKQSFTVYIKYTLTDVTLFLPLKLGNTTIILYKEFVS